MKKKKFYEEKTMKRRDVSKSDMHCNSFIEVTKMNALERESEFPDLQSSVQKHMEFFLSSGQLV